jgi:outer membrane immunogenic protein
VGVFANGRPTVARLDRPARLVGGRSRRRCAQISFSAAKGVRGAVGGDGFVGYSREFSNNLVVGVKAVAGYEPFFIQNNRFKGADFVGASAFVGYDMGRLMPYLTTSVDFARATPFERGFSGGTDAINNFLSGGDTRTYGSIGAGFDYAVTNNLTVGMGVSVGGARGAWP